MTGYRNKGPDKVYVVLQHQRVMGLSQADGVLEQSEVEHMKH